MNKLYKICLAFVMISAFGFTSFGQTLPVGLVSHIEDRYRAQQILGFDTSKTSFLIRPFNTTSQRDFILDKESGITLSSFRHKIAGSANEQYGLYLLPVTLVQQIDGHHPAGMNDGSMIPARGYQTQATVGVFAKAGPLTVQLRPEYVYAENKEFREFKDAPKFRGFTDDLYFTNYYNKIDLPERFGSAPYSKLDWGQSNIRVTFDPVSLGISNENLWWGPGVRNSLVMSNNASGFKHISLNTSRPVNTSIGSFEGQLIAGKLESSGVQLVDNPLVQQKPGNARSITGMVFTYQPKWLPNLYLGFDKTRTTYRGHKLDNALDTKGRYGSVFARWLLPESHAEAYLQYGTDRHPFILPDSSSLDRSSSAYVVGFSKLLSLGVDRYIQIGVELTSLEASRSGKGSAQPSWYLNTGTGEGYTNKGQVIGAGIGPGSNMQTLNVSWINGLKRIGLQFERKVNNNDLFYDAISELRLHWVDLAMGGKLAWNYKHILLDSQISYIHSFNYQYEFQPNPGKPYFEWAKQDADNLHISLGVMYRF